MSFDGLKRNWMIYATVLCLIVILFLRQQGYTSQTTHQYEKYIYMHSKALQLEQCQTNQQKVDFYRFHAQRTLDDARGMTWYLPCIKDKRKVEIMFNTAAAIAMLGSPQSKIVAGILSLLTGYGCESSCSWTEMQTKLRWSEYHFGMMEFHQDMINAGYP